ncbi:MAG: hypothetical protein ABIL70_05530 [candidate division WOR-3 bacterium]
MNYILFIFIFTQTQDSLENQRSKDFSYEQGFRDGQLYGEKKFYPGYCLGGCLVGAGGGCLGALMDSKMLTNIDVFRTPYSSAVGSFFAGVLLYRKPKIEIPQNSISSKDSLYIKGFIDGYKKVVQPKMTICEIGGWVIGSAITMGIVFIICLPHGLQ